MNLVQPLLTASEMTARILDVRQILDSIENLTWTNSEGIEHVEKLNVKVHNIYCCMSNLVV